jgi:hypothetical protein
MISLFETIGEIRSILNFTEIRNSDFRHETCGHSEGQNLPKCVRFVLRKYGLL